MRRDEQHGAGILALRGIARRCLALTRRVPVLVAAAALFASAACGNDSPVALGEQLLPGQPVTSFEVVLEAEQFLALDSAFALFTTPSQAGFVIVANQFAGALDARALASFTIVKTITVRDTAGTGTVIDTLPSYFGGSVMLRVDTLRSSHDAAHFAVYQAAESWDERSVTWDLRVDTGSVTQAWTQPGGTLGPLIAEGDWARADGDTVFLPFDSATVQALRDSTIAERGLIVVTETPGVRMRLSSIGLRADARSSRADTVVTTNGVAFDRTFIYTPSPGTRADEPRVGGVPSWRTLIRMVPERGGVSVPSAGEPGCTLLLSEAEITTANLEYELAAPPPGFVLEDSIRIGAVPLFETPGVPFARSPIGSIAQAVASDRLIAPSDFDDLSTAAPVRIPITAAIRSAVDSTSEPVGIALIPGGELGTFGLVPLQPLPRLRLVLTVSQEVQIQ